jgi:hypothetical protein
VDYPTDFRSGNEKDGLGYAEVAYRAKDFGGKVKFMYLEDSYRTGFDFYGGYSMFRFSIDAGYDASHETLFDGSLGLYAYLTQNFNVSANVSRRTPLEWGFWRDHYIDRFQAAASYKIFKNYSINLQQLVTRYNDNLDYLTYFNIGHKYFFAGVNYIWGDSGNERFGVSLGGNYSFLQNLRVSGGIASVDYLFNHDIIEDTSKQSYSTFINVYFEPWDFMDIRGNLSYYHQYESLPQKLRGGIAFQFKFQGGKK